jgi:hypothetical protein
MMTTMRRRKGMMAVEVMIMREDIPHSGERAATEIPME